MPIRKVTERTTAQRSPRTLSHASPHHRAGRLAPRRHLESGAIVHGLRSEPHRIVALATGLVHRVALEELRALRARIRDRAAKQSVRDTLTAVLGWDDEADDRPDRLVVDRLHHGRSLQSGELGARPEGHPADRDL